jgi:hypothetical protein
MVVKQFKTKDGALAVKLNFNDFSNDKTFTFQDAYLVHRLLAEQFIANPNNYKFVKHKDNNKMNNELENLYWTDKKNDNFEKLNKSTALNTEDIINFLLRIGTVVEDFKEVKDYRALLRHKLKQLRYIEK